MKLTAPFFKVSMQLFYPYHPDKILGNFLALLFGKKNLQGQYS
jgi:hypothetical protein